MATTKEREALETAKRASTLQVLIKCARLANERAIARVNQEAGRMVFRQALANLFPHIDLEGTRLTELARRTGVTKQAVGQLVAELAEEGVVELAPDPTDGRARLVRFTPTGMKAIHQGIGVFRSLEGELTEAVGERRMKELHRALLAMLEALEKS